MIFDGYGRFRLDVVRESGRWVVYRHRHPRAGPRHRLPPELAEGDIAAFLDDHFHEYAQPGQMVTRLD